MQIVHTLCSKSAYDKSGSRHSILVYSVEHLYRSVAPLKLVCRRKLGGERRCGVNVRRFESRVSCAAPSILFRLQDRHAQSRAGACRDARAMARGSVPLGRYRAEQVRQMKQVR
jgi:hypothetical protein